MKKIKIVSVEAMIGDMFVVRYEDSFANDGLTKFALKEYLKKKYRANVEHLYWREGDNYYTYTEILNKCHQIYYSGTIENPESIISKFLNLKTYCEVRILIQPSTGIPSFLIKTTIGVYPLRDFLDI